MPFSAPRHVVSLIRFSHHDGCCLVHPNTWYHLFGSPIMTDVVWYIPTRGINYSVQSPIMTDVVWYIPTRGINYSVQSPIMTDVVWYIPTRGINYSVQSPIMTNVVCTSRHVVSIKCHTLSRRMPIGASRQVGHFFNAIRHHDGCRLVHPSKWDIG